jgi:hypothetical protein
MPWIKADRVRLSAAKQPQNLTFEDADGAAS